MKQNKPNLRRINGILLLDKPIGISSNAALQWAKHLYHAAKAGHTGSLDPLASGMLPICFGEATKFSQFLLEEDKTYHTICQLGVTTNTDDAEGEIIEQRSCAEITLQKIAAILPHFRGEIAQLPSMFSAIKHNGRPLYKLARQGITVEREARQIHIYALELVSFCQDTMQLELHVRCSKGTYIRTLVSDIGKELGCGAHVIALRRESVGGLAKEMMTTKEQLEKLAPSQQSYQNLDNLLLPIDSILQNYPEVFVTESSLFYLRQGQPIMVPQLPATSSYLRIKNKTGQFIGIGTISDDGLLAPKKLVQ